MEEWYKTVEDYSTFYHQRGSKKLVIFIHGLNGGHGKSYWSNIPDYLKYCSTTHSCDYLFWGYESNLHLLPNFLRKLRRLPYVSTVHDISKSLLGYLDAKSYNEKYQKISVFGHSLGGLISVDFAFRYLQLFGNDSRLEKICMASSPTKPENMAKAHSLLGRKSNPHISFLSSTAELRRIYEDLVPFVMENGCSVTYLRAINDEIVVDPPPHIFSSVPSSHSGKHLWTSEVFDRGNEGFIQIEKWLN